MRSLAMWKLSLVLVICAKVASGQQNVTFPVSDPQLSVVGETPQNATSNVGVVNPAFTQTSPIQQFSNVPNVTVPVLHPPPPAVEQIPATLPKFDQISQQTFPNNPVQENVMQTHPGSQLIKQINSNTATLAPVDSSPLQTEQFGNNQEQTTQTAISAPEFEPSAPRGKPF